MTKPTFKAFLSHRYKSPDANLRFFESLSAYGNVQFEVDIGSKATNVTRLEVFVRDSDAFVGIYPFPSEADARPDLETALKESRYFRLELDLALRSRRPTIVFVDARYGNAITAPSTTRVFRYDHREVLGAQSDRRSAELAKLVQEFCDDIGAAMRTSSAGGKSVGHDRVGIVLPKGKESRPGYTRQQVTRIEERLEQLSLQPVHLDCNAAVDARFLRELENLEWAIVDIGPDTCASGLPAFLHGYFIPQMRLLRTSPKQTRSPLENTILSAFDVGYPKDIIRWSDPSELDREFLQRLTTLYEPRKYVRTSEEASAYFAGAAKRKEAVFLSYSGEDRDVVSSLARALRNSFQQVFDYRDQGESIVPGRRWIEEVFDKLSASAIGIPILSTSYFASGNCLHEARQMVGLADAGKLRLLPVKIKEGSLELPTWMQDIQYLRGWEYASSEELVGKIVAVYGAS